MIEANAGRRADAWCARALDRSVAPALAVFALSIPLPWILGLSPPGVMWLPLAGLAVSSLFSLTAPAILRRPMLSLFAWAYVLRAAALLLLASLLAANDLAYLSLDGQAYYSWSQQLAARGFSVSGHPAAVFESYDVAHIYLFAAVLRTLGGGLFSLQLLNSTLMAISVPVVFALARLIVPRHAFVLGVAVMLHPSLVALSVVNLLKDPSIVFFTALVLWALTRLAGSTRFAGVAGFGLVAAVALGYLRLGRFYTVAYLEIAIVVVIAAVAARRKKKVVPSRLAVVGLLSAFLFAEAVPMSLGWPSTLGEFLMTVNHTLGSPVMRFAVPGMAHRLGFSREGRLAGHVEDPAPPAGGSWLVLTGTDAFRKLFGPFAWVPPERWSLWEFVSGDYLLYPGMLLWYAVLPFVVFGLVAEVTRLARGSPDNLPSAVLAVMLSLWGLQYLAINLSYRQRDTMLPYWFLFGIVGFLALRGTEWRWRPAYATYWVLLFLVAAAHLGARTLLGG